MGKKKLYSPYSAVKVGEAILGNNVGRLGGLVGVDRDIQLELYRGAQEKANYWRSKFENFHGLRVAVKGILDRYQEPPARRPLYYAFAQKVAKAYAMYPEDIAEDLVRAYRYEFETYGLDPDALEEIRDAAVAVGMGLRNLYHLGG